MKKKEKGGNLASLTVGISTSNRSLIYSGVWICTEEWK
jgi:hypothetical protein